MEQCPKKKYKITFLPENKVVEVDGSMDGKGKVGLPGSILDIALAHGVSMEHVCGGAVSCTTCHVVIDSGFATCGSASEDEMDQINGNIGKTPKSRLGCQSIPDGSQDLVVQVPWLPGIAVALQNSLKESNAVEKLPDNQSL